MIVFFKFYLIELLLFYSESEKWLGMENNFKSYYEAQQTQHRRLKTDTPREKKDAKYYEKRKRNNMAAKKSREAKRRRDSEVSAFSQGTIILIQIHL